MDTSSVLSDQLKADFKRLYFRRTFNLDEKASWLATFAANDTPSCTICVQEHRECNIRSGVSIRCESCSGIKRCSNVENFKRWIIRTTLNIDDDTYNRVQSYFESVEGASKPSPSKIRLNESTRARTAVKGTENDSDTEMMPAHEPQPVSHDSGSDTEASYRPIAPVPTRKAISRTSSATSLPPRLHATSPASSLSGTPEPISPHHAPAGRGPCTTCGRTHSPMWRKGPLGPSTLCNACGLKYAKDPSLLNNVSRASAVPAASGERPRGSHSAKDIAGPCKSCWKKESPLWRRGPAGPKTLCNACGLRFVNHPETFGFGANTAPVPAREHVPKPAPAPSASARAAPTRPAATKQRYTLSAEDEVLYLRNRNTELESERARHISELEYLEAELDKSNESNQRWDVVKRVYEGRIRKLKAELSARSKGGDDERANYRALPTPSHTDDSSDDSDTAFAAASAMLMLFKGKGKRSRFDTPSESSEDDESNYRSVPPSKRRKMEGPNMASFRVQDGAAAIAIA